MTAWARHLGLYNYFNGVVDFSTYNNNALYNVIDDIPFQFLPCKKQLLGEQKVVNEKYSKKTICKGGIPCIVLCNPDQSYEDEIRKDPVFMDWAESNVIFEYIYDNLF